MGSLGIIVGIGATVDKGPKASILVGSIMAGELSKIRIKDIYEGYKSGKSKDKELGYIKAGV